MSYVNRSLNRQDYETLTLTALGGTPEFYDFVIFIFFTAIVGGLLFPADIPEWLHQVRAFGIFTVGYLACPLGGIVMAHFGNLVGHKKTLTLNILLMALPTLAIGLLSAYSSTGTIAPLLLLLMCILQGAAISGEVPGAWVFVAERVSEKRTGIACGTLTASLTVGTLLGSVIATLTDANLTPQGVHDDGWRVPFLLGGVFGLIAMYLRRRLQKTPIFPEIQQRKALAQELPVKTATLKYQKVVVVSMLLTRPLSTGVVAVVLMSPVWLQKHYSFAPAIILQVNSVAMIMLYIGCLLAGLTTSRFDASQAFVVGSLLLAVVSWAFYHLSSISSQRLFLFYGTMRLCVGMVGVVPCAIVWAFPAEAHFTDISFSYNLSYVIFNDLTPVMATVLMGVLLVALAWCALVLSLMGLGLDIWLRQGLTAPTGLPERELQR